jgi:hypothetical protein
MIHQGRPRRIAPLVPFTVGIIRRIHLAMKFNRYCALTRDSAPGWSGIDAGHRVQAGLQAAGVRHFRLGSGDVKRGGKAVPASPAPVHPAKPFADPVNVFPARPVFHGDRDYLRALRAAEMKAWELSGGDSLSLEREVRSHGPNIGFPSQRSAAL